MTKTKKVINEDKKEITIIDKFVKNKKILIGSLIALFILLIFIIFVIANNKYKTIITINDKDYTEADFNIYLFSAEYNYFGKNNDEISKDELKVIYDDETKMTVGEYLKSVALSNIKTAAAISQMADLNNIELKDKDYETLKKEKKEFIKKIGGKKEFKKLLDNNNTNELSYDKMSENDALYQKILNELYSKNSINDLTLEEKEEANQNYNNEYFKIKQIILTTVDVTTGKSLSKTTINQKETLAKSIVEQANSGVNFDELIKKYSEDAIEKEPPYDMYYKKGELLEELEKTVTNLSPGVVSNPVKTKYAYHIILREELDDVKKEDYYNALREEKYIKDLKEVIDKLKVIYHDAYEKIELK